MNRYEENCYEEKHNQVKIKNDDMGAILYIAYGLLREGFLEEVAFERT